MNGVPTEKWVRGFTGEDRAVHAAVNALAGRFAAVRHYLPLAAARAEGNAEHVHQLRVWTRRAEAALRLYEEFLPRRRGRWLRDELRRLRRVTNRARDCDVLLARLAADPSNDVLARWRSAVRTERAEAQRAVTAACERLLRGDRFARHVVALLNRVRSCGTEKPEYGVRRFGGWARLHFGRTAAWFFDAAPGEEADDAELHRFRVRGKRLRYEMELLAGAFPEEFRTRLYPAVEALQERLGAVNDLATAAAGLREKYEAAGDPDEAAVWWRLLTDEENRLADSRREFLTTFGPAAIRYLSPTAVAGQLGGSAPRFW